MREDALQELATTSPYVIAISISYDRPTWDTTTSPRALVNAFINRRDFVLMLNLSISSVPVGGDSLGSPRLRKITGNVTKGQIGPRSIF